MNTSVKKTFAPFSNGKSSFGKLNGGKDSGGKDNKGGKSGGKKGGKGMKGKKGGKERKILTGPDGEPGDDDTCWDLKHTGKCKRFPCKWKPCCDLPPEDPIFEDAVFSRGYEHLKPQVEGGDAQE